MDDKERTQRLLVVADGLYALPATEFTRARDSAVVDAKAVDAELAKAVKALRRPTVAAWVVNLFVRRESEQVDQLLDLGAALREAQEALDGEELRALSRQRRQVTAAMTSRAKALAAAEGQRLTPAVSDQVESTLTAALLDEQASTALRSGLLVQPISPAGLGAIELTAAVAVPSALGFAASPREAEPSAEFEPERPVLRLVPDPERRTKERRAAKEALTAADRALSRASRAQRAAQRRVDDLEARLLRVRSEAEEVRRRLDELETEADEVEEELVDAEEYRDEADEDLGSAQEERDAAAEALEGYRE